MNQSNFPKLGVLLSVLLLLFSSDLLADRTVTKSFDVKSGGLLELSTDYGSIEVTSHRASSIVVEVEIDGFDEDEFELQFEPNSGGLEIIGQGQSSWSWGNRRVHFDIRVPEEYNLELSTRGGSIRVGDLKGQVAVRTSGGSLRFGDIEGDIKGHTSGGSISVQSCKGDVKVETSGGSLSIGDVSGDVHGRTSGGSISLESISGTANVATSGGSIKMGNVGGQVSAKTAGGSIKVAITKQPKGDSELSTSGGSIRVTLSPDIAVDLYARGRKVYSDFEVDGKTSAEYKLKGPINGGGPELELHTSSGNVYIEKD